MTNFSPFRKKKLSVCFQKFLFLTEAFSNALTRQRHWLESAKPTITTVSAVMHLNSLMDATVIAQSFQIYYSSLRRKVYSPSLPDTTSQ